MALLSLKEFGQTELQDSLCMIMCVYVCVRERESRMIKGQKLRSCTDHWSFLRIFTHLKREMEY